MIRNVSSKLLVTEGFILSLSVTLVDEQNRTKYCSVFDGKDGAYLQIDPPINLRLQYRKKQPKDGPLPRQWDPSEYFYISQKTICRVRNGFESFYRKFQRADLYQYDQDGYPIGVYPKEDDYEIIYGDFRQFIRLDPAVFYLDDGVTMYPGVCMRINVESHIVEMSVDEFESLYDILSRINLHQEGLLLLQNFLMIQRNMKDGALRKEAPSQMPNRQTKGIFEQAIEEMQRKEAVTGSPLPKRAQTLDEL